MPGVDPTSTDALIERQLRILAELAEIGLAIARDAGAWAPDDPRDRGLTYARVARAVRQTLMLQTRLIEGRPALLRAEAGAGTVRAELRRGRAGRIVDRAIKAETDDEDEAEHLSSEAWERLKDVEEELDEGSFEEIVARICRDLGVRNPFPLGECECPDTKRWEGEDATIETPDLTQPRPGLEATQPPSPTGFAGPLFPPAWESGSSAVRPPPPP